MPDLILHHYDTSPFSEKVRKLLAHKGLPWRAVDQPSIMPKPRLTPLTGGYRRVPVLQIGADVYCDSQLIARVLEQVQPTPTLFPEGSEGTCHVWNLWADRTFFPATVPIIFSILGPAVPKAFVDDRTKMMGGRLQWEDVPAMAPTAREQCRASAQLIAAQLVDGRPYLLGSAFSLADAACFHPVWFLRSIPGAGTVLDEFPRLIEWGDRVAALGHGQRREMSADEALRIARESTPATQRAADPHDPNGLTPGARVTVTPDDYAFDPVAGEVIASSVHEIAVRRSDDAVGEVVVHFPRIGFRVTPVT